jgi:predicted AAA+ superfamily ATPase
MAADPNGMRHAAHGTEASRPYNNPSLNERFMNIDWNLTIAAVWRPRKEYLRPVQHVDPVRLDALVGIDHQKEQLQRNTERFLAGLPCNNALLWGARGTGKSSLIKALLNAYKADGLRIIQVDKNDLINLPEIVDEIRDLAQRFIVFCDDLSFEAGEPGYKALKSVVEGSVELPPGNVLIYATSNRRHLLPEYMEENQAAKLVGGEIHFPEAIEEKISLSDRFGLWLSFYSVSQDEYLAIVDSYFPNFSGDRAALHDAAKRFALLRGGRSGRTARQFYNEYAQS